MCADPMAASLVGLRKRNVVQWLRKRSQLIPTGTVIIPFNILLSPKLVWAYSRAKIVSPTLHFRPSTKQVEVAQKRRSRMNIDGQSFPAFSMSFPSLSLHFSIVSIICTPLPHLSWNAPTTGHSCGFRPFDLVGWTRPPRLVKGTMIGNCSDSQKSHKMGPPR